MALLYQHEKQILLAVAKEYERKAAIWEARSEDEESGLNKETCLVHKEVELITAAALRKAAS
jgi:hypothetical protein